MSVLLPFAVGLLGSNIYSTAGSFTDSWGSLLGSFYCIPIVIAAIGLGSRIAVAVALAAGVFHSVAAILGHGGQWIEPFVQSLLFVCVAMTAGRLARWYRERTAHVPLAAEAPGQAGQTATPRQAGSSLLGRVVPGLVRQFRTPVASIEGAGWVLEDPDLPQEKRQQLVGIVRKEAHRLDRVLSDVLDFTQPRSPHFDSVNISVLIDEVIQLAGTGERSRKVTFQRDAPTDLPLLRCDPEQLRQVLLNIIMNAVQAMPAGGQINVSARAENGQMIISIADQGRGIPAGAVDRIFDPFFTTYEHSLGLGLSVALRIVREHGGKIEVDRQVSEGSRIVITLPLRPAVQ